MHILGNAFLNAVVVHLDARDDFGIQIAPPPTMSYIRVNDLAVLGPDTGMLHEVHAGARLQKSWNLSNL